MECTLNTLSLRRLRRHRKFDVEYTLILRWKMVISWTDTFQRRIHVDSSSTFTLRLVKWIFLRSNRRRFYVEKYLCGHGIFFNAESTSIISLKVSVQTWYIFQRRFNVEISLQEDCRFINVEYTSIPRRCFPTVFVDFPTLNTRRFNVKISQSIWPVDSSTSNVRWLYVEVSPR